MKKFTFIKLLVLVSLVSCGKYEPTLVYKYNTDPKYTWGYAEFYGAYYSDIQNNNNVISLSLFSDSLYVNNNGNLAGNGQYLFLEDVFVSPTDTILPNGVYKVSKDKTPFTMYPGEQIEIDDAKYVIGSYIYFIEKNSNYSVQKLISGGSFTVSNLSDTHLLSFNFVLSDSTKLKGSFTAMLPHYDQSFSKASGIPRRKLSLAFPLQANLNTQLCR